MSEKARLSVIVITYNEENDIVSCLESVQSIASEIIVVDSGSTDQTRSLASAFTNKIYQRAWTGFSAQKQFALDQTTGTWVLNIDADERVSVDLQAEIAHLLENDKVDAVSGFSIPFKNFFLGQKLNFGAGRCERHVRLFRKDRSSYGQQSVHEGIVVQGPIAPLKSPILHHSYKTIEDYLGKCNFYTSLIAKGKFERGERFHFWAHLRLPYEFFVRYIVKLGFLDGSAGLIYALLSSYYVWLKFLKLRDLENNKS